MDTHTTTQTDQPVTTVTEIPTNTPTGMPPAEMPSAAPQAPSAKGFMKGMNKMFVFGGLILMATGLVALAIIIPKGSVEDRSQAASAGSCIGQISVTASACNEKCAVDLDCMASMTCYKTVGAVEGLCRSISNPTSTTCSLLASGSPVPTAVPTARPTPIPSPVGTPVPACKKACTFNYDCDLTTGESCVGTNLNNTTPGITASAARAATTAELAALASDQVISMGITNQYKPDATGKLNFAVVSKQATTFTVYMFDIAAASGQLDPQRLMYSQTFSIGANQAVTGVITLPRCGRYQVDFGSPIVAGTKYDANPAAHYFWGTVFEIPCQSGCCQAAKVALSAVKTTLTPTITTGQLVSSAQSLVRLSLLDIAALGEMTGYTGLGATSTITSSTMPAFTIGAISFPNVFPTGTGSVKFEVNGVVARIDNDAPFTASDVALKLPVGTYPIKATLYSLNNATGTVIGTLSSTLTVK